MSSLKMEPEQNSPKQKITFEAKQNVWNSVTPFSKYVAMILFVAMPFIGGYIGYTFAPEKVVEVEKTTTKETVVDPYRDWSLRKTPPDATEHLVESVEGDDLSHAYTYLADGACTQTLYSDNKKLFEYLKDAFSANFPDKLVYDVGSYCALEDGLSIVSYSYRTRDTAKQKSGQMLVLYDSSQKILKSTIGLSVNTLGDLGSPWIEQISDGEVVFAIGGSDAGLVSKRFYILSLDTFVYRLIYNYTGSWAVGGEYVIYDPNTSEEISLGKLNDFPEESVLLIDDTKAEFILTSQDGQVLYSESVVF